MRYLFPALLLALLTVAQTTPIPATQKLKITQSQDTTRTTTAIPRPDGTVNYTELYEAQISQGVTAENNLFIPFIRIVGPKTIPEKVRAATLKRLNFQELPLKGDYFQSLPDFLKSTGTPTADLEKIESERDTALTRPWVAQDHPQLAAWLTQNTRQLDAAVDAASTHNRFYMPPIAEADDWLVSVILPGLVKYRDLARALCLRATLRAGQGELDAAWQDSLSAHRFARAISTSGTVIERMVGYACDLYAVRTDCAIISTHKLTAAQSKVCLADLQNLHPLGDLATCIDHAERLLSLDTVMLVARGKGDRLDALGPVIGDDEFHPNLGLTPAQCNSVDWDPILRHVNAQYDTIVSATQKATFRLRFEALQKTDVDAGTEALKRIAEEPDLAKRIDATLCVVIFPYVTRANTIYERAFMLSQLDQLGFALAAHRAEKSAYPDSLAALSPAYFKNIPNDRFTDEPLHYKPSGEGFLLYSVGEDLEDNNGLEIAATPGGPRDLVFRVAK